VPPSALGLTYVLTASVLFGINGTVSKLAMQSGLSSGQLVLLRIVGAALVYLAIAVVRQRRGCSGRTSSRSNGCPSASRSWWSTPPR
jgi:drug/metabolite transporter (DMT)-like permease